MRSGGDLLLCGRNPGSLASTRTAHSSGRLYAYCPYMADTVTLDELQALFADNDTVDVTVTDQRSLCPTTQTVYITTPVLTPTMKRFLRRDNIRIPKCEAEESMQLILSVHGNR